MKKEIVFIVYQLTDGGAERVISILSKELCKTYKISLLVLSSSPIKYALSPDISVIRVSEKIKPCYKIIKPIFILFHSYRYLHKRKNIILISFLTKINIFSIILAKIIHAKIIISERNDPNNNAGKVIGLIRKILYPLADQCIMQTPDALNYFNSKIQIKSTIIHNPIKNDLPSPYKGKRNSEIVNFCRFHPQKNLFLLIDSFIYLHEFFPEYTLTLIGDGPLRNDLTQYIDSKNANEIIKLEAFLPDIHNRIRRSGMFVSSSNYEGISNSMLEAMALGLPTICTDCPCGGAKLFIESYKNGILVPPNDPDALFHAMKFIIENPDIAKEFSENALNIKEKISVAKISRQWISVIENC